MRLSLGVLSASAHHIGTQPAPAPARRWAIAGSPGGAQAPSSPAAGGSEFGVPVHLASAPRPLISALRVPTSALAGPPPQGDAASRRGGGWHRLCAGESDQSRPPITRRWWPRWAGRTRGARSPSAWPAGATLAAGSYEVSVSAHDHHGGTLLRRAHSSGQATLTVKAPPPPPVPAPTPTVAPVASEPGVPTPAQTVADGAVFPVAGPHNFGGPENRFGAPRAGHIHQGQDVLTERRHAAARAAGRTDRIDELPGGRRRLLRGGAHHGRLRLHVRPLRGRARSR